MRHLLLSVALIAFPVGVFAAGYSLLAPSTPHVAAVAPAPSPSLGDMTPYETIVTDVQTIAATGDLTDAEKRITDLETAWDDALTALRAKTPDAATAYTTLASLQSALADPSMVDGATGSVTTVAGVTTTDANGRALPCEVMLDTFRTTLASATLTDANRVTLDTLQAKGTERCDADDDARADDFFAQGIALMSN